MVNTDELRASANRYAEETDGQFEFAKKWSEVAEIWIDGAQSQQPRIAELELELTKSVLMQQQFRSGRDEWKKIAADLASFVAHKNTEHTMQSPESEWSNRVLMAYNTKFQELRDRK